jgi:hypothetical protein
MKKILLFLVAILVSWGSILAANLNVWELELNFCNGSNKLSMDIDAQTSTGICMQLINLSAKAWKVMLWFVDGEMSQGSHVVQACKTDAGGPFGKSVSLYGPNIIDIQPNEIITRTGMLTVATGFVWTMYGCITYTVLEDSAAGNSGQMFSVISRKANTITVNISWELISKLVMEDVGVSLSNNPLVSLVRNWDGGYTVWIKISNKWTANELVNSVVRIQDDMGYKRELPLIKELTLLPEDSKDFNTQIDDLPWYGGKYTITVSMTHQASAANSEPKPAETTETVVYYAVWLAKYGIVSVIGAALVLILILFLIIFKRRKHKKKHESKEEKKEEKKARRPRKVK